jgi:hypothetical protein
MPRLVDARERPDIGDADGLLALVFGDASGIGCISLRGKEGTLLTLGSG